MVNSEKDEANVWLSFTMDSGEQIWFVSWAAFIPSLLWMNCGGRGIALISGNILKIIVNMLLAFDVMMSLGRLFVWTVV